MPPAPPGSSPHDRTPTSCPNANEGSSLSKSSQGRPQWTSHQLRAGPPSGGFCLPPRRADRPRGSRRDDRQLAAPSPRRTRLKATNCDPPLTSRSWLPPHASPPCGPRSRATHLFHLRADDHAQRRSPTSWATSSPASTPHCGTGGADAERTRREVFLVAERDGRMVEGYTDWLAESPTGELVVVDYMTDSVRSAESPDRQCLVPRLKGTTGPAPPHWRLVRPRPAGSRPRLQLRGLHGRRHRQGVPTVLAGHVRRVPAPLPRRTVHAR